MEYDTSVQKQRKRLGSVFILFLLACGILYLWYPREGQEPPTSTPPIAVSEPQEEAVPGMEEDTTPQEAARAEDGAVSTPVGESGQETTPAAPQRQEELSPAPAVQTGTVTASRLNVRDGPSAAAEKISTLPRGEQVSILREEDGWYRIEAYDGSLEGWVAKRYVETPSPARASSS